MVNKALVFRLMGNIEGYLSDLATLKDVSLPEFKRDVKLQRFTERTLQIMIETMIDIAHHIISDDCLREPDSYADAFAVLSENGVVDDGFLGTLKQIAQFRNKLVHYYDNMDSVVVYDIATKRRGDVEKFVNCVRAYLGKCETG